MLTSFFTNPLSTIIFIILLLVTIAVHEFSHAKIADYLGDPTPRLAGRLTLNPFVHIDLFGLLFLFLFGFGWGKPVPFDPFNLKNPKKDAALISLAGPGSNFITAIVSSLLLKLFILFKLSILLTIGKIFLPIFIYLNLLLGIFNLLPIAPLDGFKIVAGMLSQKQAEEWYQLERYGMIFLLLFIFPLGQKSMLEIFLSPVINFLYNLLLP
jgi:Zn-dependent protease